jgi:DNA invertase Pin-like site-specific DNA recombinase
MSREQTRNPGHCHPNGVNSHGGRTPIDIMSLGRSMPHLIATVSELEGHGVDLRSLTEQIDTTTPGGRLIFHVFGALGQFERDLIRERTRAGLKAAEARGRCGGRKSVVTVEKMRRARQLMAKGLTAREAVARIKVGETALYRALQPRS